MSWTRRLQKELKGLQEAPPVGISLASFGDGQSITEGGWILDMVGAEGSLYSEERFQLRFTFTDTYPMEAPIVVFVGTAPVHEHIYSNGHICLNVLTDDWSPALTVEAVCLSIQSMLSSATVEQKVRPKDDTRYTRLKGIGSPKDTKWAFHDDGV